MDQKGHKIDQKGLKYMKRGFWTKNTYLLPKFGYRPPPKQKLVCQTKLAALGVTIYIWQNPDTFEIVRKISSHLEKSGQF